MPIYGYKRAVLSDEGLLDMREVSLDLSPADLRRVAAFMVYFADRMDAEDWRSDHAHLDQFDLQWKDDHPDLDIIILHHREP
jgi:hypothetical protein